jgi:rare lipoprotein A
LSTVLAAVLLATLVVVMHFARADGKDSTTKVVTAAPERASASVALAERVEPERASRSAGWARQQIEQLPLKDFTPTTTAAPVITARRAVITTTTVRHRPPATTATTRPKPPPTTAAARRSAPPTTNDANTQSGRSSWYEAAPAGTCAHRTLPMGTMVTVTRVSTGASTVCRVADRGPYANGWIIDLSKANFSELAPLSDGVIDVRLTW